MSSYGKKAPWSRLIAATLTGLGVFALGAATKVASFRSIALLATVGGCCIVTGALIAVVATKLERLENGLLRDIGLAKQFSGIGLAEVWHDSTTYNFDPLVRDSRRLVILLNDGRTWLSVHRDKLRSRLQDPSKETVVFLIHPESPMVEVLARKASKSGEVMRNRIRESVELLNELRTESTRLEILGHAFFNPQSIFLGDERVLITPYFVARGGRAVPVFAFDDTGVSCYFKDIENDVELLRMDAQDIGKSGSVPPRRETQLHALEMSRENGAGVSRVG